MALLLEVIYIYIYNSIYNHMGVSKNRGTPKWMVYSGKSYEQMDDLGGFTPIFGNTYIDIL